MQWDSIIIGGLIGVLSYLASRMLTGIDDDLKDLKKSQYVTNERLARIEAKSEALMSKTDQVAGSVDHVDKSVKNVNSELSALKIDTVKALNETKYQVDQTKQNFGKILVVLKGLVLKTKGGKIEE